MAIEAAATPVVVTTVGTSGIVGRSGMSNPSAARALERGPHDGPAGGLPPPPVVRVEPPVFAPSSVLPGTSATSAGDADGAAVGSGDCATAGVAGASGAVETSGSAVALATGLGVGFGVGLAVARGRGVGSAAGFGVAFGVAFGVGFGVGLAVGAGVAVGFGVGVGVAVGLGVGVGFGVGVAGRATVIVPAEIFTVSWSLFSAWKVTWCVPTGSVAVHR